MSSMKIENDSFLDDLSALKLVTETVKRIQPDKHKRHALFTTNFAYPHVSVLTEIKRDSYRFVLSDRLQ